MKNIQLSKESREDLLKAAVMLGASCQHPKEFILGQFPSGVGGKEKCLICGKSRTQLGYGGPWRSWK